MRWKKHFFFVRKKLRHYLSCVLKWSQDMNSCFSTYNTLRTIAGLFFQLFPVIISWCINYSFPAIFIYKSLNFLFSWWFFSQFLHGLIQLLHCDEIIYHDENIFHHHWQELLLLFCFLSSRENLYMIQHNSVLFCDIYNTAS